jgi:hypothetical protein
MTRLRGSFAVLAAIVCLGGRARGGDIDHKDLLIAGLSLEVDTATVVANVGIPAAVQTKFGGRINDDAPPDNGMTAIGDLSGPGIDTPIRLVTKPGHLFQLPALNEKGDYILRNIRLVSADGNVLQIAVPSFANITITQVLDTKLSVHQLTPDELRARGITIDSNNFDVYEYTFLFAINGQTVTVPYPVIIDKRSHEIVSAPAVDPYHMPALPQHTQPPRFQPPATIPFNLLAFDDDPVAPQSVSENEPRRSIPTIPAALVIPTGLGVLHQFFAVILNVGNSAPAGSAITVDSITANLDAPPALRLAKTTPAVTIGQAVPIVDSQTGAKFLVAAAQGSAEWSLEALKAGTHSVAVQLRATYKAPNQPDAALKGDLSASFVVSDPRFQVNFVHPQTIRSGEEYTAYAFITNTSAAAQTIRLDVGQIPVCSGDAAWSSFNVCFPQAMDPVEATIERGKTLTVPYHLKSRLTGNIFAAAGDADDNIKVGVALSLGVSASGIPLSPATLLMPWYTRYADPDFVSAQMTLLGLGYSLAVAPLSDRTALLPRVIPDDVFRRAQDVARAGERMFIQRSAAEVVEPAAERAPLFALSLDLLSNVEQLDRLPFTPDLKEWDDLRRSEESGRSAAAALARQLERVGLTAGKSASDFANDFAAATAHRSPYALAIVHGATVNGSARPYAMTVTGRTSHGGLAVPSEAAPPRTRSLPFAELTQFHIPNEYGELAIVGRFSEAIQFDVVAAAPEFSVELIYPAAADGSVLRASLRVTNAGSSVSFVVDRGLTNIVVTGGTYVPISGPSVVAPPPLAISGAAQDLHLNDEGRTVSLLFNRPITVADASAVRDLIALTTDVPAIGYHARRRNTASRTYIPGAALQADGRTLDIYFDKTLSKNAAYTIDLDASLVSGGTVHPRIDIDIPSGLLYGKVLRGDNTPIADAPVALQTKELQQFDRSLDGSVTGNTDDSGRYLFEYIPRDDNRSLPGTFKVTAQTANALIVSDGIIRSPGELRQLNLVFLGRGTVTGFATYSDGRPLAHATVVAGSAGYNNPLTAEMKTGTTAADGAFTIGDLPVGPFTLSVSDGAGNVSYAANQIHAAGEVLRQDLVVRLRPFPGTGTVRVTVRRSDISAADPHSLVAGAHVGVFSEGFGLVDGFTDANGRVDFAKIPAGTISILAANFDIARESAGVEADLHSDSTLDEVLTLNVPNAADLAARATLTGTVFRDDPFNPANVAPVPGAIVTVAGFASVTAGGDGKFTYEGIPLALAGKNAVRVFDPGTGRQGAFSLPTPLVAGPNPVTFVLSSTQPKGYGTFRVRLFDAAGQPVSHYRVLIPGFPATPFNEVVATPGVYELANVAVPHADNVLAVPQGIDSVYGDQTASGSVRLDFNGQTSTLDLRLPGQGTVIAHLGCAPGVTDCKLDVHSPVVISYKVWNDAQQEMTPQERRVDPGADSVLRISKVPVNQSATVATLDNPLGYASAPVELQFQGQQKDVFLTLTSTSTISGRVLNWDRQTPIFGALVHLDGGFSTLGNFPTAADGSFRISGVAANAQIRVIAEYSIDGVFRTGSVDARTPLHGGPLSNLVVILQEQAGIDGTIVDGNGAPVPLARYWARELSWPYQTHGSFVAPLSADRNGHFVISNVFAGGIHISAQSPQFQEQRGEFEGTIAGEANNLSGVQIVVGAGGTGTIAVTTYDGATRVANAEVTLNRNGVPFDFGQSDANGIVTFDNVPVGGGYAVQVISRARARAGSSGALTVTQGAVTSVDIGLSVLGVVSGTLVDGETNPERPIAGGHITLISGNTALRTSTDGAGAYRFDGVPEGRFSISGFDFDSGRSTPLPAAEFVLSSTIQELTNVKLTLEPTASLDVHVFLPNDAGGPGAAAPLVDVTVGQGSRYSREQQGPGSGLTFPKLFAKAPFHVAATELGGESRTTQADGTFANGATTGSIALTFPASGAVQVTVASDDPNAASLIASSKVTIVTSTQALTLFPDASGNITVTGVQLGSVSATAVSQGLSASASGTLASRTIPLHLTLMLGRRITMTGHVEAEAGIGQPSVHTRVVAAVSSSAGAFTIETRTDAAGNYSVAGVPLGNTSVHFDFYGVDDATRGAQRTVAVPDGTVESYPAPNVKLDATAPRVVSIDPSNNANSVAPNSPVTITFTEALDAASVNSARFRVIASDDSQAAPVLITTEPLNGQFRVRLTPTSLLKSNMTYTVSISDAITDPSGNKMTLPVTTNFTTVDYTEPRIVGTTPSVDQPVGDGTTFYLRFNKAIDASVFANGGSGLLKLEQLDHNHGTAVGSPLPVSIFIDPKSASTLVIAPVGVALQPASFYRITENGARDTLAPPNTQTTLQTFDFFSADHVKPVVTIDAPAASTKLTAGVDYIATVSIVDEGTAPPRASNDIAYVQWFDGTGKALTRATTAPYGYVLRAAAGVTSVTLKASAVDLSGNASDLAAQTWEVTANLPPQNIAITVPPSAYVARTVGLSATFDEDGLAVTSALTATGKHRDGTPYALDAARIHRLSAQPIRRNAISDPWPAVQYSVDVPADLKEADALQFALTLTDSDNQSTPKTASVDILADANPPHITAMLPAGETRYKFGDPARNHYRAQVNVTDAESGVAHVTFVIDGHTTDVRFGDAGSAYANGTYTFFTDVDVAAKNVDTRIHIAATAFDYDGNQSAQTADVIYESVNDGTAPTGSWMTPLDGALVAKGSVTLLLRVHAVDDVHVDTVTFDSALFSSVTADRLANDLFEKSVTFDTPSDGSPFVINATISDSGHQTILPITIDQTVVDLDLATDSQINSGNAATFANKSVRIHGAGKKLYISVPVTLQNLIVSDGANAGNPDGTKIDLTVTDRLYVDGSSSIDVTGKGFLGGWASHESGGQNATPNGLTLNNAPGAAPAATGSSVASGSYAGIAGIDTGATTNATYGSITNPADFGSGGSGAPNCNTCVGGNGGGAVVITGGSGANDKSRFVIAGAIRADGQSGAGIAGAGSGGSINLHARALVAGWAARITANGGDDDGAANTSRGGGGGRIAAVISDRWDVEPSQPVLQARGGRNDSNTEARAFLEGGAGTLFVQKPGEANGELLVSSFDERHASSLHLTRATPLAGILNFDSIVIGPRALARFDAEFTAANVTIDPTAVLLHSTELPAINLLSAPAAGTSLIQGSTLPLTYNAQSNAGVGEVRATLAPAADLAVPSFDYPASIATTPVSIIVPNNATPGAATLKLRVTDRAGRTAETPSTSYTIVANAGPAITQFDIAPASLQMYAGHPITVTAAASDDLEVKTLTLTSSSGTIAPVTPSPDAATHGLFATFVVNIPPPTPAGTVVALTLTATDGSGVNASQTKSVTVLHDANAPAATIDAPSPGVVFVEGSSIPVSATIVDAEVSVKQASASIDGVSVAMTQDVQHPTVWTGTLAAPDVDGTADVPKTISVTASDFENNTSTPATVSINVRPIIDALAPTVTWTCATPGAMYPSAAIAKLQVLALPASGDTVTGVTMTITDTAGTRTVPMTSAGGGSYTYDYTLPAATSDANVTLRAVATTLAGKSSGLPGSLTIIAPGPNVVTLSTNATIAATDTAYEGKTVLVTGGKLTIAGKHTFARLAVLNGATVAEVATDAITINRLDFAAAALFVACGGSIDVTGAGFLPGRTWNNTTTGASTGSAAGSHGGTGGFDSFNTVVAVPYGSLYDPNEPGGGGATPNVDGRSGGGIVRIQSPSIQIDGKIIATGTSGSAIAAGAGGSIRIDTNAISGSGEVRADGGTSTTIGGGGGRVAIYYVGATGLTLSRARITAAGGAGSAGSRNGTAGTVYLRQLDGAGAKVTDELVIDNGTVPRTLFTPLVDLGTGTITAVNGNVLTLSVAVPVWVAGSSIEILDAGGAVIATYEIASSTTTSVTVIVPNGQTLNAPIGSAYRGSSKIATFTVGANATLSTTALHGDDMTLSGEIETTEVRGRNLTLKSAAVRQTPTTATTTNALRIITTGTLSVDAASVIDAVGRGYLPGRTFDNTTTGGSTGSAAGSHGGTGGSDANTAAAPYGSLYDPKEPGSGGSGGATTGNGGGVIGIQAPSILLDGQILATGGGIAVQNPSSGGGGSIRIDAATISGIGQVHADGGPSAFLGGGGGRVAIYYTGSSGLALTRTKITAAGGVGTNSTRSGAPGTVYLKRNDQANGELIVDNGTVATLKTTPLTSVGSGVITSVSSSTGGAADTITDTSAAFPNPNLLSGNRIYVNGDKSVLWPTRRNTATALTLDISANALTAQVGQPYSGLYRFDTLRLRNAKLVSVDAVESLTPIDKDGVSTITASPGNVSASATFTVMPAATLASITLSPTVVVGGTSTHGTITLTGPAPAGGASVPLGTSNPSLAIVPTVVVVAEGETEAKFVVTTAETDSSNTVTITGTYGSTQSAMLTITACSPVCGAKTSFDFRSAIWRRAAK